MPNNNLEGVFVEGKPLMEFLEYAERDDKSYEIEDVRKDSETKRKVTIVYQTEKGSAIDTRKVARRVRHLTDRQIREEYGIMKKPFKSKAHNAIWAIWEKGPITVKDIIKETEFTGEPSSASAMISTIWNRLGEQSDAKMDLLTRKKHDNYYLYSKKTGVDLSVEQAIDRFKISGSAEYRRKAPVKVDTPKPNKPMDHNAENVIRDMLRVTEKALGVEVKVSGRVEIVFKFER